MLNGIKNFFKKDEDTEGRFRKEVNKIKEIRRYIETESNTGVYDIAIAAQFDMGKDADWMELQFRRMNEKSKTAFLNAIYANQYKMRYYLTKKKKDLIFALAYDQRVRKAQAETYMLSKKYEDNIYRAENDQTCECKPRHIAIKEDLVTNFGLSIIIENFMLFNNLRFDQLQVGTGTSDPFGGEKALEAPTITVSITDKGFAVPYGNEARHGAPVLASEATHLVHEVGIRDSLSTRLYSRSVFPISKRFEHQVTFDAYSILHITQLKAF